VGIGHSFDCFLSLSPIIKLSIQKSVIMLIYKLNNHLAQVMVCGRGCKWKKPTV